MAFEGSPLEYLPLQLTPRTRFFLARELIGHKIDDARLQTFIDRSILYLLDIKDGLIVVVFPGNRKSVL